MSIYGLYFLLTERERILEDYEEFDNLYLFLTRRVSFTSEIIYIFVMVLPSSDGTSVGALNLTIKYLAHTPLCNPG